MNELITEHEAVFKQVHMMPFTSLKCMADEELDLLRQRLIREVREVGRALQWVDGIIKLKNIETNNLGNNHD